MRSSIRRSAALFGLVLALGCSSNSGDPGGSTGAGTSAGGASGGSAHAGNSTGGSSAAGSNAGGSHAGQATAGNHQGGTSMAGASSGGADAGTGGASGGTGGAGDGGAPGGDHVIAACLDAPVIDGTRTEALSFEGDGVALGIVRRVDPNGFGTSGTTIWLPERFALVRDAVAECVSEDASLSYTISHHNFDDKMSATSGAQTWTLVHAQIDYGQPQMWAVDGKQGDTTIWGPIPLELVSCTQLDTNEDCTAKYQ